jgi:hypothetical protein
MLSRLVLSFFVFWVVALPVAAQQFARHALKVGISQQIQHNWALAYEFRFNAHTSLELAFEEQTHHWASEYGLFNGELLVNYAIQQKERFSGVYPYNRLGNPEVTYLGNGRPLAPLDERIPLLSRQSRLGYRFSFATGGRQWRYFLQPGLALTQHRFFNVRQQLDITGQVTEEILTSEAEVPIRQVTYQTGFQQRQTMLQEERWLVGAYYSMGLGYRLGRRLLIEAQVTGLFNPEPPYEAPQPVLVRNLQVRGYLHVGVMLGKMRGADRPKKNWQPAIERM